MLTNTGLAAGSRVSIDAHISSITPDPDASNNAVSVTVTVPGGPVPTVPGGVSAELALTEVQPVPQSQRGTAVLAWDVTNLGVTPAQDVVHQLHRPRRPDVRWRQRGHLPVHGFPADGPG